MNYRIFENRIIDRIDQRFTVPILIDGEIVQGVFNNPQQYNSLKSDNKGSGGLKYPESKPELHLNKQQGNFNQGDPVHLLCGGANTDYKLDQFYFNETDVYRVTLQRDKDKKFSEIEQDTLWQ